MGRIIVIWCVLIFAGCKKSDDAAAIVKAQAKIDDQLIQDYINKNNLPANKVMIGTADTTGIWYINTISGTAPALLASSSLLTVGYTGRLLTTGMVFAQTDTYHPSFHLGDMIKGWQYGIVKSQMKKGGTVRLLIASRYAYGAFNQIGIPANSVLDFDIELFDVTN